MLMSTRTSSGTRSQRTYSYLATVCRDLHLVSNEQRWIIYCVSPLLAFTPLIVVFYCFHNGIRTLAQEPTCRRAGIAQTPSDLAKKTAPGTKIASTQWEVSLLDPARHTQQARCQLLIGRSMLHTDVASRIVYSIVSAMVAPIAAPDLLALGPAGPIAGKFTFRQALNL
jgi:hypothetical protein